MHIIDIMQMNTIVINKFNDKNIDYSIQEGVNLYNISVYANYGRMLYYQTYKMVSEYCGDISFKPIRNEFNNANLFDNAELKILFGIECEYPDVDYYYLDNLFNSEL